MFQRYRQVFTPIHATNIQLFADTGKFLKQKTLNTSLLYDYLLDRLRLSIRYFPNSPVHIQGTAEVFQNLAKTTQHLTRMPWKPYVQRICTGWGVCWTSHSTTHLTSHFFRIVNWKQDEVILRCWVRCLRNTSRGWNALWQRISEHSSEVLRCFDENVAFLFLVKPLMLARVLIGDDSSPP